MQQRARKLVGLFGLLALLIVYPLVVAMIGANWLAGLPWWGTIAAVMVAALIWLYPASRVVKWMAKPD